MKNFTKYENKLPRVGAKATWDDPILVAYREENCRLRNLFKADALAAVGLTGHPKADRIFEIAWGQEFGNGFAAIYDLLKDLAELVLDQGSTPGGQA